MSRYYYAKIGETLFTVKIVQVVGDDEMYVQGWLDFKFDPNVKLFDMSLRYNMFPAPWYTSTHCTVSSKNKRPVSLEMLYKNRPRNVFEFAVTFANEKREMFDSDDEYACYVKVAESIMRQKGYPLFAHTLKKLAEINWHNLSVETEIDIECIPVLSEGCDIQKEREETAQAFAASFGATLLIEDLFMDEELPRTKFVPAKDSWHVPMVTNMIRLRNHLAMNIIDDYVQFP